jgi:tRNA (Thr-GGU) A37 N-methylase
MPYELDPIGVVHSRLQDRSSAPCQGDEGAPDAWIELTASFADALEGINTGDELIVITWLHEARRDVLKVHPRGDLSRPSPEFSRRVRPTGRIRSACTASPHSRSLRAS